MVKVCAKKILNLCNKGNGYDCWSYGWVGAKVCDWDNNEIDVVEYVDRK